jgi:hypothetical protein
LIGQFMVLTVGTSCIHFAIVAFLSASSWRPTPSQTAARCSRNSPRVPPYYPALQPSLITSGAQASRPNLRVISFTRTVIREASPTKKFGTSKPTSLCNSGSFDLYPSLPLLFIPITTDVPFW